jgi:prophage antirepressor-like protein
MRDVCDVLGYANHAQVAQRLDMDEKDIYPIDTLGGTQSMVVISESGLYSLIMRSNRPEATEFRRWVTHDVLPSIRRTGSYTVPHVPADPLEQVLMLATRLQETAKTAIEERQKRLQAEETLRLAAPKVQSFDALMSAGNNMTVASAAKILGTGQKRLFSSLRNRGIFMKSNLPYQEYLDRGYFEVKTRALQMGDTTQAYSQTYVTPRGLEYLRKALTVTDDTCLTTFKEGVV